MKLIYSYFFFNIQEFGGVCCERKGQRCNCMDQSLYKAIQSRTTAFATAVWCVSVCVRE